MKTLTITEARAHFSELLGRVARGGESVLITKRGKPVAKVVPTEKEDTPHLGDVQGWLDDDDPFFEAMDAIVERRHRGRARVFGGTPFDADETDA